MIRVFAVLTSLGLLAAPALATCKEEVAAAFAKQRDQKSFRMVADMVTEQGPLDMTVNYLLPDRMHQTVKAKLTGNTTETILVGDRAWTNEGKGWVPVSPEFVHEIAKQMQDTVVSPPESDLNYACLGLVTVDGKELRAYRSEEPQDKTVKGTPQANPPMRLLYTDPATGLPVKTTVARAEKPDSPFFKTDYSYPPDIKIEPPAAFAEPNQTSKETSGAATP